MLISPFINIEPTTAYQSGKILHYKDSDMKDAQKKTPSERQGNECGS